MARKLIFILKYICHAIIEFPNSKLNILLGYNSVELSTLSTRGWVMQERILAARTIFFTEEGIFWQCSETSSSEFKENISTNWEYKSSPESARPSKPGFNELAKSWRTDAQEYVTRARVFSNLLLGGLL